MLRLRTLLLSATLAGCDAGEPNPKDDLPDGPFVRGVLHDVDGSTRVVTAPSTYTHDGTVGRCWGEQRDDMIVLVWPHRQIAVGDFDLREGLAIHTATAEDMLFVVWSGWIQFDALGDEVEGRFELGPDDEATRGVEFVDRGAFRCMVED